MGFGFDADEAEFSCSGECWLMAWGCLPLLRLQVPTADKEFSILATSAGILPNALASRQAKNTTIN
jgi:hypothetical protein